MKNNLNIDLFEELNNKISYLETIINERNLNNKKKFSSLDMLDSNEDVILLNIFKDAKLIINLDRVSILDKKITAKAVDFLLQEVIEPNDFVASVTIIKNYAKFYNIHNKKKIEVNLEDDLENNYVLKK